ncbi:hypothetical protein NFI96_028757 [Prochilodus magdalenae]|nr:hypothetical protein NFI96_028757 [Prochilodus magdalenae]
MSSSSLFSLCAQVFHKAGHSAKVALTKIQADSQSHPTRSEDNEDHGFCHRKTLRGFPEFRLIVIGDSTVGKSCLIRRFTEGRFAQVSDPTVGVDFFSRLVEIEPGKRIKLQIWDTAGQERFRSITRAYYRNSVGGLLLFDITNRRSFQNVHEWLEEARSHVQPHSIVFLLVGHKCDLETQRQVSQQEAEKLAAAYGMRYVETSARDAINVERAFTELTRDIFELVKRGDITIQEGWEGVKSGFVPNVVHSSEEVTKSDRRCLC